MITRKDIAKEAGVSTATVTRVTSGKGYVSDESRRRVLEVIGKYDYFPSIVAQNFSKGVANILAVLIEDTANQHYAQIFESMNKEASKIGLLVCIFSVNDKSINDTVKNLISNRVKGIINLTLRPIDERYKKILAEQGSVLVCPDGKSPFKIDYGQGVKQIFEYLKAHGKTRLAFFAGLPKNLAIDDDRFIKYIECVKRYGFVFDNDYIVYGDYPALSAFEVGKKSAKAFLETGKPVDAVFCLNDMIAVGVLSEFYARSVKVPEDVSVIGCDNIAFSSYSVPTLSTLDVDREEEGLSYVKAVIEKDSVKGKVFSARLIVRESLIK